MTGPGPDAAAARVDLHAHSTASDGALSPTAMVEGARAAGLAALALTDHDSIDGLAEARVAGEALGVRIIAGVELSAYEGAREIHILGLHLQELAPLERELEVLRAVRKERAARIVERLTMLGVPIALERVLEIAAGGAIGRPHIATAMVEAGHVADRRAAFDRFLGAGRPAFFAKHKLSVADAIRLIHEAGGIAVLAHPGSDGTLARIQAFAAAGGDGIEVRHPGHSSEDAARLGAIADHLQLVPSGGSDCHGALQGPRSLGSVPVPIEWMERQEARVRERAAQGRVA